MNFAIVAAPDHHTRATSDFRRFALVLVAFVALPTLLLAAFVITVDPYYVFGSPSWQGFNDVRPYYEPRALIAKPYQVRRKQPAAVALGSSRVEVGIDPRHPGWIDASVFNFALPASNSYAVMLAFLHAQKTSSPLKQAVVGLDFFGFNINFPLSSDLAEQRFAAGVASEFATFLDGTLADRHKKPRPTTANIPGSAAPQPWNEALYLAVNPDVKAAVTRNEFKSGREHWELAGRAEHRQGTSVPAEWDEAGYLQVHPDVANAVSRRDFASGYHHYLAAGRIEKRLGGFQPADWSEIGYLAANPDVRTRIALGNYRNGYLHYAASGRSEGRLGGFPATNAMEKLRLRWPPLTQAIFQLDELFRLVFSKTAASDAVNTIFRQSELADFDGAGMRIWQGREDVLLKLGGVGTLIRSRLSGRAWAPWLTRPKLQYCFTNMDTGATMFDPFRFMLRKGYAEGTDLRLYTTPLNATIYQLLEALDLGERYEFWLKELVRINGEEAARAGRQPYPLWDFGNVNTITGEAIPPVGDLARMHGYWDHSHYRRAIGDLILDRIFSRDDPAHHIPADFGMRMTGANIDAHLASNKAKLAEWVAANSEWASQIVAAAKNPKAPSRQAEATCW